MKATEDTEFTGNEKTEECETELIHGQLTGDIRQVAFEIHRYFGYGFLEKVYENRLAHRLRKGGHVAVQQSPLSVRDYDGTIVGEYFADILVDGLVVVEIKAAVALRPEHQAKCSTI